MKHIQTKEVQTVCRKLISLMLTLTFSLSLVSCVEGGGRQSPPPAKVLFIGNSAVYVNDIPGTLSRLAEQAGYTIRCESIVKGGATIHYHADTSTEHGKSVLETIQNGSFDMVFIQDNTNCISSESSRFVSQTAFELLNEAISASGARTGIYFRAPYGHEKWGLEPVEQSRQLDLHFSAISEALDAVDVYVNRAFTIAMDETVFNLYADDIEHTNKYGAYLAVCTFFATLFRTSSDVLDADGLPLEDARTLQAIADRVALRGETPFSE